LTKSGGLADTGLNTLFEIQLQDALNHQRKRATLENRSVKMEDYVAGKSTVPYGVVPPSGIQQNTIVIEFAATKSLPARGTVQYMADGRLVERQVMVRDATPKAISQFLRDLGLVANVPPRTGCGLSNEASANLRFAAGVNKYFRSDSSDVEASIRDLRKAVAIDPRFSLAKAQLAQALAKMVHRGWYDETQSPEQLREATQLAKAATIDCPKCDHPWKALGLVYQTTAQFINTTGVPVTSLGQFSDVSALKDSAVTAYYRALQRNSRNFWALNNLVSLHGQLEKPDSAEAVFRRAVGLVPTAAEPYINMADVLIEEHLKSPGSGLLSRARDLLDSAQHLNPDLGLIYFNRAACFALSGNDSAVSQELAKAFDLGDYDYRRLVQGESRTGRPFAAVDVHEFFVRPPGNGARLVEETRLQRSPLGIVLYGDENTDDRAPRRSATRSSEAATALR
jgi:tetratricopeptide (TPR) repeat protein